MLLVWDEDDPHQAAYLEGALMVALGLATRKQEKASEGDLEALNGIEERVAKEIARLERVKKLAEMIRLNAEKIAKEVGRGEDQLRSIVKTPRRRSRRSTWSWSSSRSSTRTRLR